MRKPGGTLVKNSSVHSLPKTGIIENKPKPQNKAFRNRRVETQWQTGIGIRRQRNWIEYIYILYLACMFVNSMIYKGESVR